MSHFVSKLVYVISLLSVSLAGIATIFWVQIVREQDGYGRMGFAFFVAPCLIGTSLLFGVFPGVTLYLDRRNRRDLQSVWMSAASILLLLCETAMLFVFPFHRY